MGLHVAAASHLLPAPCCSAPCCQCLCCCLKLQAVSCDSVHDVGQPVIMDPTSIRSQQVVMVLHL